MAMSPATRLSGFNPVVIGARISRSGQATALRRAYQAAGYDMSTLAFVEGHGTGTRVGDKTELEAIATVLADAGEGPARALGVCSAVEPPCPHSHFTAPP